MTESICERILEVMDLRNLKQKDIVEKTGIDKGQLSSYLSGKYKPKLSNINLIAKALDVNEAWLMGYDVPMEREVYKTTNVRPIKVTDDISDFLSRMEQFYNILNEHGREEIIRRAEELELLPQYNDNKRNNIQRSDNNYEIIRKDLT